MSTLSDLQISLAPAESHGHPPRDGGASERRDRRESYRVALKRRVRADYESPCRLTDISTGGVGFLAPRRDAAMLENALVLVHVANTSFRAVVQRVDVGGSSKDWVRVGARFTDLADEERASLTALVTAHGA